MRIQQTNVVETDGDRALVEILIADQPDNEIGEFVKLRVEIPSDQSPHFLELQKVALQRARAAIAAELQVIQNRLNP